MPQQFLHNFEFRAHASQQRRTRLAQRKTPLLRQSEAMSAHVISRESGGSMEEAAKAVKAKSLIIVSATERVVNPGPALSFAKLIRAEVLKTSQQVQSGAHRLRHG